MMCTFLFSPKTVSILLVGGQVEGEIQCGKALDARVGVGVLRRRRIGIGTDGFLLGGAGPRRMERDGVRVRVPPPAPRLVGVPAHMQGGD